MCIARDTSKEHVTWLDMCLLDSLSFKWCDSRGDTIGDKDHVFSSINWGQKKQDWYVEQFVHIGGFAQFGTLVGIIHVEMSLAYQLLSENVGICRHQPQRVPWRKMPWWSAWLSVCKWAPQTCRLENSPDSCWWKEYAFRFIDLFKNLKGWQAEKFMTKFKLWRVCPDIFVFCFVVRIPPSLKWNWDGFPF